MSAADNFPQTASSYSSNDLRTYPRTRVLTSQLDFKPISPEQTIHLRHKVLWPSISIDDQLIPEYDLEEDTIHLGAFLNPHQLTPSIEAGIEAKDEDQISDLIGVLTLANQRYDDPSIDAPVHIQLHKFAIHPSYQSKGIGRHLLAYAIQILKTRYHEDRILFHFDARVSQKRFYEKCGMSILDDKTFWKFGKTGNAEGVEYVKMGCII
ncbi:hypothetical protein I204_01834 [Kwoniella mangroviensis CBS 8886]|nr:hypothetical protein I204_01834 [Kwoniella mangroviensis CBS 8886]